MTAYAAGRTLLRTESRLFLREPIGLVWGLLLPVAAFVALACIPALHTDRAELGGASYLATYQPIIIVFAVTMLALNGLPPVLGAYRERGVLRRLRTTPMPPARLLLALLTIHLVVAAIGAVLVLAASAGAGLAAPKQLAGWVVAYLLGCAAMLGLGVLIAAATPSGKIANAVGAATTFPVLFFAGLWVPRPAMSHLLRTISDYTPLGATVRALTAASAGHFPSVTALAVDAGYAVGLCLLSVRLFRWE